jgi:dihydroorotate dehydrogenase (fumarate)
VVLQSLFEEQIDQESDELDRFIEQGGRDRRGIDQLISRSLTHRVIRARMHLPGAHSRNAKQAVKIPVVASLNGTTQGRLAGITPRQMAAGRRGRS